MNMMTRNWLETARHRRAIGDVEGARDAVATARIANRKGFTMKIKDHKRPARGLNQHCLVSMRLFRNFAHQWLKEENVNSSYRLSMFHHCIRIARLQALDARNDLLRVCSATDQPENECGCNNCKGD